MRMPALIVVLLALQGVCALFFTWDILSSLLGLRTAPLAWELYELLEIGAALSLVTGVVVTGRLLALSLQRAARAEQSLRLARGAFAEVLAERFDAWGLTPAERDVALFAIKGLSTADIAALRTTSEGTVKAQTAAIYRKAGVSGRPQLLSLFVDELMEDGLTLPGPARPQPVDEIVDRSQPDKAAG